MAAGKKACLYVRGCEPHTSADTVKDYIKEECPEIDDVDCIQLSIAEKLKVFQVSYDFKYRGKINNANFWSVGIKIRCFNIRYLREEADIEHEQEHKTTGHYNSC